MNQYPNGPQQPYPTTGQMPPAGYPSNPGYPPPGPNSYTQYPSQPGYPQVPQTPPQPQQAAPKKKSKLGIGCGVVAAVVVLIAIIAIANSGKSNTGTAVTTSSSTTNSQPATQQTFKVGDTVKVGSTWQIVVDDVKTDDGGAYSGLKSGDTYLVADITMTNLSGQEQNVSSLIQWSLQDSTGQKYDESVDPNLSTGSLDGKVEAGQPIKGEIDWEVPSGMKSFQLHFQADLTSDGQTTWNISVS